MAIPFTPQWSYECRSVEDVEKHYVGFSVWTLEVFVAHLKRLVEYHKNISAKKWHLKYAEFELKLVQDILEKQKKSTPEELWGGAIKGEKPDLSEVALKKWAPWDVLPDYGLRK